jgi:WD40 repeat protein
MSAGLEETLLMKNAVVGSVVSNYSGTSSSGSTFLSWSPDNTHVVTLYDSQNGQSQSVLQVWNVKTSKTLFTFANANTLQVAWSPDGKTIAAYTNFYNLYLFNASNGQLIKSYTTARDNNFSANSLWPIQLVWSFDSQYLALDTGVPSDVQVWNVNNDYTRGLPSNLNSPRVIIWSSLGPTLSLTDAEGEQEFFNVSGL